MAAISDLRTMLAEMRPVLNSGRYAFVALPEGVAIDQAQIIASVREAEGLSVIVPEQVAVDQGLAISFTAAWITLTVHSDLAAVGLTAAFSQALATAGIGCNVVAGVHHDHLFVPFEMAERAMAALGALSRSVAGG